MTTDDVAEVRPDALAIGPERTHPWRRYFAKFVDMTFVVAAAIGVAAAIVLLAGPPPVWVARAIDNNIVATIILAMLWVPTETVLLSAWGTTPARWIFGITVRGIDGRKLLFKE